MQMLETNALKAERAFRRGRDASGSANQQHTVLLDLLDEKRNVSIVQKIIENNTTNVV